MPSRSWGTGLLIAGVAIGLGVLLLRGRPERREVVVYTALDPVFSRAILAEFEAATGIRALPVFDTEASKTTGLVERLRRERRRPRCDVFWSNEVLRTIRLAREGIFEAYPSRAAEGIPARFRDPGGLWTGFAARARALAFDPERVRPEEVPRTHEELLDERWRGRISIANPQFGTTGSHLAFLLAARGEEATRRFLEELRASRVQVVGGNSTSRDRVVSGEALLGLTDTDDVEVVRRRGVSIDDALFEGDGTILIPNSVALVKGAPHPREARALIDFLLDEEIEARLAASPSRQIPLRAAVPVPEGGLRLADLRLLPVSLEAAADALPAALEASREILGY